MTSYSPLDTAKNEVRMLTIVDSDDRNPTLVHCRLEIVSLNNFTTEFSEFLEKTKDGQCSPEIFSSWFERVKSAAAEETPTSTPLELPYWRHALHYGMDGRALDEWDSLMEAIDIDFEHCLKIPPAFAISSITNNLASKSLQTRNQNKFSFLPRFQWRDYEAISYCWESETKDRQIVLNGSIVDVPRNLEAMLQRLRKLPDARSGIKFWIDALCIDQANILEKGHQVKFMQTIYTRGLSLVVWLGSASEDSDQAIDFIASITHHTLQQDQHGEERYGVHFPKWQRRQNTRLTDAFVNMPWKELLSFLSRNYWQRLWIIQELAMNHNMTLFLCGEKSLSRSMILRVCQFCMRHAEMIDQITPSSVKVVPDSSSYTYGSIWSTIYRVYCLLTLPDGETDEIQTDDVLDLGRKANVKEAVDKIYGILGLLPPRLSTLISPDYTLLSEQVYFHFAKFILIAFQKLDVVFSWCSYRSGSALPTWVPDWSTQYNRNHLYWLKQCNASGSKPVQWSTSDITQSLNCRGFIADSVHTISGSLSESNALNSLGNPAIFECPSIPLRCQYNGRENLTAALRRTLVQNLTYPEDELHSRTTLNICWVPDEHEEPVNAHFGKIWNIIGSVTSSPCWEPFQRFRRANENFPIFGFAFRDFFPSMPYYSQRISGIDGAVPPSSPTELPRINTEDPIGLDGNDALVMKRTTLTLQGRRLITTTNGYLGTAPEAVLKGDILAILYGCNYPVVLRPCGDCYMLIGESYIDGAMDGELVEAMNRGEFEEIEFKIC